MTISNNQLECVPFGAWWYLQLTQQFGIIHRGFFSHSPIAAQPAQLGWRSSLHTTTHKVIAIGKFKDDVICRNHISLSLFSSFLHLCGYRKHTKSLFRRCTTCAKSNTNLSRLEQKIPYLILLASGISWYHENVELRSINFNLIIIHELNAAYVSLYFPCG